MYDKNPPENGGFVSNLNLKVDRNLEVFALYFGFK